MKYYETIAHPNQGNIFEANKRFFQVLKRRFFSTATCVVRQAGHRLASFMLFPFFCCFFSVPQVIQNYQVQHFLLCCLNFNVPKNFIGFCIIFHIVSCEATRRKLKKFFKKKKNTAVKLIVLKHTSRA